MANPNSTKEWFALARQHERAARLVSEDKLAAGQSRFHAGSGVEAALKAYIMHTEGMSAWPSRKARPDLYVHDLRDLAKIAGVVVSPKDKVAPAWKLLLDWDRSQAYDPKRMPRTVARQWVEAAFDPEGFVEWVRRNCR